MSKNSFDFRGFGLHSELLGTQTAKICSHLDSHLSQDDEGASERLRMGERECVCVCEYLREGL